MSFACKQCGKCFVYFVQQSRRVGRPAGRERGTVTCKQCGKRFTKSAQLEAHLQLHLSGRLLTCKVCLDTFTSRGRLLQHKQTKHYTSQPQVLLTNTVTIDCCSLPLSLFYLGCIWLINPCCKFRMPYLSKVTVPTRTVLLIPCCNFSLA